MLTRSEFLKFCGLALLVPSAVRAQASDSLQPLTDNDSKCHDPKADALVGWQSAPALPIPVQEIYAATVKNQLYVAGGIAAKMGIPYFNDRCFKFDGTTSQWQEIAKLPLPMHHVSLVCCGDRLLAVGGFHGGYTHVWRMLDSVLELKDEQWESVGSLPTPRAEGVVAYHERHGLHVVSGQSPRGEANSKRQDHHEVATHWVLDRDQWSNAAPLPTPRNSASGGWVEDQLVVAGGRSGGINFATNEIYDAKEDRWRQGRPMPLAQAGTACVMGKGSMLVFGGEVFTPEAKVFGNVWRYDINTDLWCAMPGLNVPRHGLAAGRIGDHVYAFGGAIEVGGRGTSDVNERLFANEFLLSALS